MSRATELFDVITDLAGLGLAEHESVLAVELDNKQSVFNSQIFQPAVGPVARTKCPDQIRFFVFPRIDVDDLRNRRPGSFDLKYNEGFVHTIVIYVQEFCGNVRHSNTSFGLSDHSLLVCRFGTDVYNDGLSPAIDQRDVAAVRVLPTSRKRI